MIRRSFFVLSIVSMMNLAALIGYGTFAWNRGWLEKKRVHEALAVLRDGMKESSAAAATSRPAESPSMEGGSGEQIRRNAEGDEVLRTELQRREQEIQNAWRLLETQQLALVRQKEDFDAEKKRVAAQLAARAAHGKDDGFEKELEILGGVKAKDSKELLRQKPEPDVVRILAALDVRKARKIVSECKTQEERLWIGRILDKLHERDAAQAEVLRGGS
jgi:hypothetical protein